MTDRRGRISTGRTSLSTTSGAETYTHSVTETTLPGTSPRARHSRARRSEGSRGDLIRPADCLCCSHDFSADALPDRERRRLRLYRRCKPRDPRRARRGNRDEREPDGGAAGSGRGRRPGAGATGLRGRPPRRAKELADVTLPAARIRTVGRGRRTPGGGGSATPARPFSSARRSRTLTPRLSPAPSHRGAR